VSTRGDDELLYLSRLRQRRAYTLDVRAFQSATLSSRQWLEHYPWLAYSVELLYPSDVNVELLYPVTFELLELLYPVTFETVTADTSLFVQWSPALSPRQRPERSFTTKERTQRSHRETDVVFPTIGVAATAGCRQRAAGQALRLPMNGCGHSSLQLPCCDP
jgi:hypothetical protein